MRAESGRIGFSASVPVREFACPTRAARREPVPRGTSVKARDFIEKYITPRDSIFSDSRGCRVSAPRVARIFSRRRPPRGPAMRLAALLCRCVISRVDWAWKYLRDVIIRLMTGANLYRLYGKVWERRWVWNLFLKIIWKYAVHDIKGGLLQWKGSI